MSDSDSRERTDPMAQRAAGLAGGLGALVLVSGVFFTGTGLIVVNNAVAGALIATAAAYTAAVPDGGPLPSLVGPIIVLLVGAWVVASPFVYGIGGPLLWSSVVLGALVIVLAGASAYGSLGVSKRTATGA